LIGGAERKRPLLKPRHKCEDNIKMDFINVGYDGDSGEEQWHDFVIWQWKFEFY
jgi:hypothetical protein